MGILSGKRIAHLLLDKELEISPLEVEQIQTASVVLRLGGSLSIPEWGKAIDLAQMKKLELPVKEHLALDGMPFDLLSSQYVMGSTLETLKIPDFCVARIYGLHEHECCGLSIGGCIRLDPGFRGLVPLSFRNQGAYSLKICRGMPICRLELEMLEEDMTPWRRRGMDEADQKAMAEFFRREFVDKQPKGVLSRYLEESIRNLAK